MSLFKSTAPGIPLQDGGEEMSAADFLQYRQLSSSLKSCSSGTHLGFGFNDLPQPLLILTPDNHSALNAEKQRLCDGALQTFLKLYLLVTYL